MLTTTCNVARKGVFGLKDVPVRNAETWAEAIELAEGNEARALDLFNRAYVIAGQEPARQHGEELLEGGAKADSPEFAKAVGEYLLQWTHSGRRAARPKAPQKVKIPSRRMSPAELQEYLAAQGVTAEIES